MPNFLQRLWDNAKAGETKNRAHFELERNQIDRSESLGEPFQPRKHYFQMIINEMFLAHQRQWFAQYDPMVFSVLSHIYDKDIVEVPKVTGPALLSHFKQEIPLGMVFKDTPVSGYHPYQGGAVSFTVILGQLQRQNNADRLLNVIEQVSGAINPSNSLTSFLQVATTIVDGVESLLGLSQSKALVGIRATINPNIGQELEPAYYVLIDAESDAIDRDKFWVKDNQLCYGDDLASAEPYREHDFVLFSIVQGLRRDDERTLSFYPLWETTQDLAARPDAHHWKEAKAHFNTLKRQLLNSPDLTRPDYQRLRNYFLEEIKRRREETVMESDLGGRSAGFSSEEQEMQRIADELDALDDF